MGGRELQEGGGRMHWVCSTHLSLSSHIYVNVSVRRTSKAAKTNGAVQRGSVWFEFRLQLHFHLSLALRGRKVSYWKIYVSFVFVSGRL